MKRVIGFLLDLTPARRQAAALEKANLRIYGARSLDFYDLTKPTQVLSPVQIRGMAGGLPLFYWSDVPIALLAQLKPDELAERKESMEEWWGIANAEQALDILNWLQREGHRQKFKAQLKHQSLHWRRQFAAHPLPAVQSVENIAAWDYVRSVCVARWCHDYGYLSWEQVWPFIDVATRRALRDFTSWESFAASFLAGRLMWSPESDSHAELADIVAYLVKSPDSPWRYVAWHDYPAQATM
ncbi:DUF1266 domain-containing protein [Hymenobacter sp. UYP22]|uniref:DUF1266 domain-containing protein n=1 Tax=Hymenobacter sp. UYP22 TaxID=3156348 RepID=UPI0033929CC6